jgi:hypothetical protein
LAARAAQHVRGVPRESGSNPDRLGAQAGRLRTP